MPTRNHSTTSSTYGELANLGNPEKFSNSSKDDDAKTQNLDPNLFGRPKKGDQHLVLLVEDNRDQAALLTMRLKTHNLQVLVATNGFDALEILTKERPRLIISDLMMPGVSGSDLLKTVKSSSDLSYIPFIILSAALDNDSTDELLDQGACLVFDKAERWSRFIENVLGVLEGTVYDSASLA